jgi:hypothetical protein
MRAGAWDVLLPPGMTDYQQPLRRLAPCDDGLVGSLPAQLNELHDGVHDALCSALASDVSKLVVGGAHGTVPAPLEPESLTESESG